MATISPFRGWRVDPARAARVAAPPYDVVNEAQARAIARDNPDTFLRVTKPEILTPPGSAPALDERGALAAAAFLAMQDQGIFAEEPNPAFYVYRLALPEHTQTGLVACVAADEYESGVIRKHELTRRDKEDERASHIEAVGAQTGPVLMAFRRRESGREILRDIAQAEPTCDFIKGDGVRHTLWTVTEAETVRRLQDQFESIPRLYIADGHHRAAAAVRVRDRFRAARSGHDGHEEYNRFLAVLFPDDELRVLGYHRTVKDLNGLTPPAFLARLAEAFETEPVASPPDLAPGSFGLLLDGAWYRLRARTVPAAQDDPVDRLDASVLQQRALEPILGIRDIRTDPRVDFVGGADALRELERRCEQDARLAFALAPVAVEQIMAVADADRIMPPKSTWFEPKLCSGLVAHAIGDGLQ